MSDSDDAWLELPSEKPAEQLNLPAVIMLPDDYRARLQLVETCFARLTDRQRLFLSAYRDCRCNARAAERMLGGTVAHASHSKWMRQPDYATVVRAWTAVTANSALDRDRLLARQEDIVETLLTPKPVLHQGLPVFDPRRPGQILEEVEAGAASRANEVLLDRVMPKNSDVARTRVIVNIVRLTGENDPEDETVTIDQTSDE